MDEETEKVPIDLSILDEVMERAKGYYEMVGTNSEKTEEVVMRFNLSGLRNNYRLNDLTKMNITLYGVCVGKCRRSDLWMENELRSSNQENDIDLLAEQDESTTPTNDKELELYDILLAGVEK